MTWTERAKQIQLKIPDYPVEIVCKYVKTDNCCVCNNFTEVIYMGKPDLGESIYTKEFPFCYEHGDSETIKTFLKGHLCQSGQKNSI